MGLTHFGFDIAVAYIVRLAGAKSSGNDKMLMMTTVTTGGDTALYGTRANNACF